MVIKHVAIIEDNYLHSLLKLGPWIFHYGEAYRCKIISCVDWRAKNNVVKGVNNLKFLNIFIFHVDAIEKRN
jgi:hypothetical protein